MMYFGGGGGGAGWIWMGFAMIVFLAVLVGVAVFAVRSFNRGPEHKPQRSTALVILEERYARGEISSEEFNRGKQLIQGP